MIKRVHVYQKYSDVCFCRVYSANLEASSPLKYEEVPITIRGDKDQGHVASEKADIGSSLNTLRVQ